MEGLPRDPDLELLERLVAGGLKGLSDEYPDEAARDEVLRRTYGYAWHRLHAALLEADDPSAEPRSRLLVAFDRWWDCRDNPELHKCAQVASMGYWSRNESNAFDQALFIGQPEGGYEDRDFEAWVQEMVSAEEGQETPEETARYLMFYATTVYTMWLARPPREADSEDQGAMSIAEAQYGVANILNHGAPSPDS